ncbi:MAG: hypothetical protein SF097_18935 [Acidobacteriota bacterium]|nr:hypothetical protein [Acidobacteriota bacterium]
MTDSQALKNNSVSETQKRDALEAALHSNTFSRADQIKSFLKYICEMEIAGRGHELTEYLIGVEALGRPSNYSPGDDSAVRNRAFALRKKLQEFYEHESSDAHIRIELTKGSYCPRFVEHFPNQKPDGNGISALQTNEYSGSLTPLPFQVESASLASVATAAEQATTDQKKPWKWFVAGVVMTSFLASLISFLTVRKTANSKVSSLPPIVAEAWGPILTSQSEVLVSVANPPSLVVHKKENSLSYDPSSYSTSKDLGDWVKQNFPLTTTDQDLFLSIVTNSTYWGDTFGAMTALKMLVAAGAPVQTFPEKVISIPTLRRKNVILFGAPEYSPAIAHYLEKCPLTVNYLRAVVSREQTEANAISYSIKRDQKFRATEVYGLITVLPSKSSTYDQHRTVIFSGVISAGTQAAAEFFSSPEHLLELRKQLKKQGYDQFPPAYQVVVRAEPEENILLNFRYETHRVLTDVNFN